jgi:hypothetical protein
MDLDYVEEQLKKNWSYGYRWHGKQDNRRDALTRFIYRTRSYDDLVAQIGRRLSRRSGYKRLADYAHNRWYNFWSAMAVEEIFKESDRVDAALNQYDRLVDFRIDGIRFDHKTSVFPGRFRRPLNYAVNNPRVLIEWLYRNQSQEKRLHLGNRLFVVLYAPDGKHWKLKAEIRWLQGLIEGYVRDFDADRLVRLEFIEHSVTLSDIIWGIRE